jgi:hypothetical protein
MKKKYLCFWSVMLFVCMTCTAVYVKADANPLGKFLSDFPLSGLASPTSGEVTEKVPESLSLDDLPSGWDSDYDSSTHTITYLEEWGGKGWSLGDQDASDYAYFVVEFATPTLASGNVLVQSTDGSSLGDGFFDIGCTKKVLPISDGNEHLQEIFIQGGSAGISFVLQAAYFTNEIMSDEYGTPKVSEYLSLDNLVSGWDSEYDSSTHTITLSGNWGGKGWWLKDQDASDYAYFVVEFATPTTSNGNLVVQTVGGESTGEEYCTFKAGCVKKVIPLPAGSNHLQQIFIQGYFSGTQYVLQAAYFTNDDVSDEYGEETPKVSKNLPITDLTSGWGDSTYDPATHTITIGDDWSGKGWWFEDVDASDYEYLVVCFSVPTAGDGQVGIELIDNSYVSYEFYECCKRLLIQLPGGMEHLKQIYIKGPAGSEYVLEKVFFATENEVEAAQLYDKYWYPEYVVSDEEWQILKDFYDSVDNTEEWNVTWDFSAGSPYVGDLEGVETEDGHVKSIFLNYCHLKQFPTALLSLPYLERLQLYTNEMSDNLTELAEILPENSVLKYLDIDTNQMTGNVGLFASRFLNLEELNACHNQIDKVSPMISPNVYVYLDGQTLDQKIDINIAKNTPEEIREQLPEILTYDHYEQSYNYYPYFYFLTNENTFCLKMNEDVFSVLGYQDYKGSIGDVYDFDAGNGKLQGTIIFDQGDSNFDGDVNVLDLQADINHIFGEWDGSWWRNIFNFTAANLWADDQINVQDVVPLVNLLMDKKAAGKTLFYESFDQCEGVGGNDEVWDNTDEEAEIITDNYPWEFNNAYGANQCVRLGYYYYRGYIYTPTFTLNGKAVLSFKAAASSTEGGTYIGLYVDGDGSVNPDYVETQRESWTEYEVLLEGHGEIRLEFYGDFQFLDEIRVIEENKKSQAPRRSKEKTNPDATLTVSDGDLVLNTTRPVAAFDIVVDGATSMKVANQLKQQGFTTEVRKQGNAVHLIGYSLSGGTLPIGETVLGTVQKAATVSRAMLSDSKAKEIVVGFSGTPTSITQPAASDTQQPASEVYRLPVSSKKAIVFDSKGKKTLKDIDR